MQKLSILKSFFGVTLLLTPFLGANARQLNPEEAIERALSRNTPMMVYGDHQMKLSYTESLENNDYVYVFNNSNKGFIVLSADDRMPAILGYSDNGPFDYETISPALKWWLSQYAAEAATTEEKAGLKNNAERTRSDEDMPPIPHLIKTEWGQQDPFNLDCPIVLGYQCVTGCVATAMAQVIKYHGFPAQGTGSNSYGWNGSQLSFDYSNANFDYSNMLDAYIGIDATEDQRKAVANLMYACGVAVNMAYNLNESGAYDNFIPYALQQYFGYDNETRLLKRAFYQDSEWTDLIYSELKEGRPVIYGGQATNGGHQFICDGYDGDGFFHINWGWQGLADGYFRLSSLDPEEQGVGGFEGGYNSDQTIVCGIQPAKEGTPKWYSIYGDGCIIAEKRNNTAVDISFNGGIFNYSPEAVNLEIEIMAVAEDGTKYFPTNGTSVYFQGAGANTPGYNGLGTMMLPKDLPEGSYKCYIVIKTPDGRVQEILFAFTDIPYFIMEVDAKGNITCRQGEPIEKARITVVELKPISELVSGELARFNLVIENIGDVEYTGRFSVRFFEQETDNIILQNTVSMRSIPAGDTHYSYLPINITLQPGSYEVLCFDKYNEPISDIIPIKVGDSGVESIMTDSDTADIYTANGVLIMKKASKDMISSLPNGLYILNAGGKTYKVIR